MTDPVLTAWLTTIAKQGWSAARIDVVARAAGVPVATVAATVPDRFAALQALGRTLDAAALEEAGDDPVATVRDRLFELLMARFEAAQDHRAAVAEIARAARRDPALAAFFALALPQSVARLAAAAGVDTEGIGGVIRVEALSALLLVVSRDWLADDSDDLSATMKALDAQLARAETWARRMPYRAAAAGDSRPPSPVLVRAAVRRSAVGLLPG